MSIVRIEEDIQPLKYLVITQERDPESVVTTNVVLSDNRLNKINLINIERGPQGDIGPSGLQGPPGENGINFEILAIGSGGTNNTSFTSGNIIFYDGEKLSSSNYTFNDIINLSNPNAISGVINGDGLYKISDGNTVTLGANVGDGLSINNNNQIVVDNTIVRKVELNLGSIDGVVPISKGGTNNQTFISNRLLYYDGAQISSFPLSTGRILLSGTTIDIVAGSGLIGGGKVTLPSGSIVLNIGDSSDIIVETNSISLSVTGSPGTYSKITTDSKGRVISGTTLTQSDILNILGYTPWNANNDGEGSGLDADLLDGQDSTYFRNLSNSTGTISNENLPIQTTAGTFTKVQINDRGIVVNGLNNNYFDIVNALGYVPVNTSGDTIYGSLTVNGDVVLDGNNLIVKDNLPTIGTNSSSILPSEPRGFSFLYGGYTEKTGILAYYPAEQQLRLVTNISSLSGVIDGGNGSGNQFMDDIDGGDQNAVYLYNNLTGVANIVLFKSVADSLYVSRVNNQAISGLKTFVDGLTVNGQLKIIPNFGQNTPPITVGNNSNMVENLNVDLLHGHNDNYYRNAINMTGLFSYQNVEFDNLDGTDGYLARFDSRTSNPSRTVSNSIIKQKTDSSAIVIENNANLFIGTTNSGSYLANRSIIAGTNNKIYQDNSLAVGTDNIVSGENSVALNTASITLKSNSIAAGNNGYTWSENQSSFGAFIEKSGSVTLGQGQYSTVALGLSGINTNGEWSTMSPTIIIPKNKTIAYNLQVLLNKSAGTGGALISYQSGIIKNSTFRDPNNATNILNVSSSLRDADKNEIYNDSQYRDHYYGYKLNDNAILQNLRITRPPIQNNSIVAQNVESVYSYVPSYSSLSGSYVKTNDGYTLLSFDKPVNTGIFYKNSGSHQINVKSYDHNMVTGCLVGIVFTSGSSYKPHSKYYEVINILDKDNFTINETEWAGWLTNNTIYIDNNSYYSIDKSNEIILTGIITTNSNVIYSTTVNPIGILSTGMSVVFGPLPGIYPSSLGLLSYGKITSLSNNSITIDSPYTGLYNNTTINCSGFCKLQSYSEYHFNNTNILQINIPGSGYTPVTKISGISYVNGSPFCDYGISISITGLNAPYSGQKMSFTPAINNSGSIILTNKRNYNGSYSHDNTEYKKYDCFYTQYQSVSGVSVIELYNQELQNIKLPSAPFKYSLVCGYGGSDNNKFYINNNKLYANTDIPFASGDKYYIRVASTDGSNTTYQENMVLSSGIYDEFDNYTIESTSFDINNILIKYDIKSSVASGDLIASFLTQGGYAPYVVFHTASNSISGVLTSGSNIITDCIDYTLSGYPTSNINSSLSSLRIGMVLYSNIPNVTYSGTIIDSTGNIFITDTVYTGVTTTGLLTYSGIKPNSKQYYPDTLFVFNSSVITSPCSNYTNYVYTKGFAFNREVETTGHYVTGIASVYTDYGTSKINITSSKNIHLYPNINNDMHIKFINGALTGIVSKKAYPEISGIVPNAFDIEQKYLYPQSGTNYNGQCTLNLNQNHGYDILDANIINQIPINFISASNSNSNRLPKNNLFDIISITGNNILIKDSDNYLLKEINRPDYFEQPVSGMYSTNGFNFNGIFISGTTGIYDCFYISQRTDDPIGLLSNNTTIGSTYQSWDNHNILTAQSTIHFSGLVREGSGVVILTDFNPSFKLVSGMTLYCTSGNISLNAGLTKITKYSQQSGIIDLSFPVYGLLNPSSSGEIINLYIKPYIGLDKPLCLDQKYVDTGSLFFNGNQINIYNFSTPRSYLNINDQIKILQLNNTPYGFQTSDISRYAKIVSTANNNTNISGISTNKYSFGTNRNINLNPTGIISFIGSVSGYYNTPLNNIYYHSYGGVTSNWPRDTSGKYVNSPITGYYTIGSSSQTCQSGTLCVNIQGFSTTNFNSIIDLSPRVSIGKNDHIIYSNNTSGYVRPWGVANRKFYFDFSDDCPEINGVYYVNDKIDYRTITINIPYDAQYLGRSGLVYIIDSEENIKSNLNPNVNNVFFTNNADISIPEISNLYNYSINSFNNNTKRWKHLVNLNNSNIKYSGYDISIKQNTASKILSISPDHIVITNLQYSIDDGVTYNSTTTNDSIVIPSTQDTMYVRLSINDGSKKWSNNTLPSAPKINIYGLSSYSIDTENIVYNFISETWYIDIIISNINLHYDNHKITFTASDESGRYNFDLYLTTKIIPQIYNSNTAYTYQNGSNWILSYTIQNLTNNHLILMSGYPGLSYNISDEQLLNSSGEKIVSGPPGAIAGTFTPTLIIKDLITDEILASQESTIVVLPLNQSKPTYTIFPIGLDDDIYLNYTDNAETKTFDFYISAVDDQNTDLVVSFEPDSRYSITPIIEYSNYSQRYRVTAIVSGSLGYYPFKNVSISLNQPTLNENDELEWNNYTFNKSINLTLYRDIAIYKNVSFEPINADISQPWSIAFTVTDGIVSDRPDIQPRIKLSNLPNIGTYENQVSDYTLTSVYNTGYKRWDISVLGKPDYFQRYAYGTGLHNIKIYVEDDYSFAENNISLMFTQTPYMANVKQYIYGTPNNGYQSNVDVKNIDSDSESLSTVSIPSNIKESTISTNRKYRKYDSDLKLWELAYSGNPIYNKWDVDIDISNTGISLGPNSNSIMSIRCKGIGSDKIYGIGKLDLIELDSNFVPGLPLTITGVVSPYYSAVEGNPWQITFSTIGGLENPNYPPTILLSGLPTPCSGYNPKIPLEQQNACYLSKSWNSNLKRWDFIFEGLPLCSVSGPKNFSITAIDTDNNLYYGSDQKNATILYSSLIDNGSDHPGPIVVPPSQSTPSTVPLYPLCNNSSIDISYKFGSRSRNICPAPTGITGWVVSGSLPPGLSYSISFPGGNPKIPWSNLGSGTIRITGIPTTFANGGLYNEQLYLTVRDARNKSFTKEFKFTDASTANPPSPINLTVYFDSTNNVYTTRSNTPNSPSGTEKVDKSREAKIDVLWPPADEVSLDCLSVLPHNQCLTSNFYYDGGDYNGGNTKVLISGTKMPLPSNSKIYVEFNYDPNNNYNGKYIVESSGAYRYITIPGQYFDTGSGKLVLERINEFDTKDLQQFNGTLNTASTKNIMGCGYIKYDSLTSAYGLYGRMHPAYTAEIKTSGSFKNTDVFFTGLDITKISRYQNETGIYSIKTSNCWETGYLRISGICVPKPSIELTNPPPAYDLAPFSYNNQAYSVLSRCVYGNSSYEKDLADNYRVTNVNYILSNISNNTIVSQGVVGSLQPGLANGQPIQFNNTLNSGAIFSLKLSNNPSVFPTYIYNSIPYTKNEYFWVHKAGSREATPTQASFPAVIVTGLQDSIYCMSGSPISGFVFRAVGGYVPYAGVDQQVPFYRLPNNNIWNLVDYAPHITGIVQQKLNKSPVTGTYMHSGQSFTNLTITLPSGYYQYQDLAYLTFPDNIIPSTGIIISDNSNIVDIYLSRPGQQPATGYVIAYSQVRVEEVSDPYILLRHNNLPFNTGDYIDISSISNTISTEFNIFPFLDRISVVSGNSSYLKLSHSQVSTNQYSGIVVSGYYDLYRNYYDQINTNNMTYIKDGEWRFDISGINSGLYKDYNYKIISIENTGLPIFSGTDLSPKKSFISYPLYIQKPIKILLSQDTIDNGIINNNGIWSLSFNIDGGKRPLNNYNPEIYINNSICNFSRQLTISGMKDQYNSLLDQLVVTITSVDNPANYDWKNIQSFDLKVEDETGYDLKTINLNQ